MLKRRLLKNAKFPITRHLKFKIAGSKSTKLLKSKTINKKPVTTFKEFCLSHQKPASRGRRTLLEDLFKKSATSAAKRQRRAAAPLAGDDGASAQEAVCRRLFFVK